MRKSRISKTKQLRLIEHFVAGTTTRCAASLVGVNKREVDESYFGGTRKGNRGREAAGTIPVFGLLKRGGCVCTKITPDAFAAAGFPLLSIK